MNQLNNNFYYRGTNITTDFKLGEEQKEALEELIDYVLSDNLEPITLSGSAGCLSYGTKILMFDGSYKEVQDIVVGDKLMGIDSTPRTVLELKRGREQMYWIHQNKGMSYRVNESHILSTKHHKKGLVNQTVLEYLSHKTSARDYKGYKSNLIEFPEKELKIDPYFLGLWLGDGTTSNFPNITNNDIEIEQYLKENFIIKGVWKKKNNETSKTYNLYKEGISEEFKKYFGINNKSNLKSKFIPKDFIVNSSENRKKLLAGLIDTDGYIDAKKKEYEIITKSKQLAKDIVFLVRSLGFYVNCRIKNATCTNCKEKYYKVWRITFSVDRDLPIRVERKKVLELSKFKNRLHTGLRIEKDIVDNYYGFTLDKDNLFILEDFTVTHNSGKTSIIKYLENFIYKHTRYNYNFLYAAPTHAATVYLGLNLGFLPYTLQSIVVNRYDDRTKKWNKSFSTKFELNLMKRNVLVIDESSMISSTDLKDLLFLAKKHHLKIIFLGDKSQIPEVSDSKVKQISEVFTSIKNVNINKVYRTSDNDILDILTEIRSNPDGYLPVIEDTDNLKFYNQLNKFKFYGDFLDTYMKEPEDTIFITYTNNSIKIFNNSVRKDVLSDKNLKELYIGETIVGYGGYNNKTVLSGNLANSIRFKVTEVNRRDSYFEIKAFSKIANNINEDLGNVTTNYLPLSLNDSIIFDSITLEDMEANNKIVSSIFRRIYLSKKNAINTGNWKSFYSKINEFTKPLSTIDLGSAYIYVPDNDKMELFDRNNVTHRQLKSQYPELFIDKGIDFGYAITIHKSQGSTYKNVFFDSSSTENNIIPLMENNVKIGTEGNSLNYVGMSRAKSKLFVLYGSKIKRLEQ